MEKFMFLQEHPNSAKKLKKDFGLTQQQAKEAAKDLVDDSRINYERLVEEIKKEDREGDSDEEELKLSTSRTRSGRVSRPPIQIDEEYKKEAATTNEDEKLPPPPSSSVVKQKRNFNVPPRFRCKVCNKIYLGDRKMNRHIKNYPGHGPMAEPSTVEAAKQKIPTSLSSMPIIPLARTQLEELVKNLDAELVLDVVSKKMFDNFSIWDLQMKKASLSSEKGLKVLEKLFNDTEKVLSELKHIVDRCLTITNLSDKESPSVQFPELLQLALSGHDGPHYLEQPNHIPQEYHNFFGIESTVMSMVSPRSESSILNPPEIDDNTSSLLSGAGSEDKEPSNSGGGAKMVLEKNLGAERMDEELEDEEETQEEDKIGSPVGSSIQEEDSNISIPVNVKKGEPQVSEPPGLSVETLSKSRTRLPSFSSIIAGSPKPTTNAVTPLTTESSVLHDGGHLIHHMSDNDDHMSMVSGGGGGGGGVMSRRSSINHDSRRSSVDHGSFDQNRRTSLDQGQVGIPCPITSMDMLPHSGPPSVDIRHFTPTPAIVTTGSVAGTPIMSMRTIHSMPNSPLLLDSQTIPKTCAEEEFAGSTNILDEISSLNQSIKSPVQEIIKPRVPAVTETQLGLVEVPSTSSNSANFLSDLESVLGETSPFSFNSALNTDHHMSMKNNPTPEKLLMKSIPPSSMMVEKKKPPLEEEKEIGRTDFLGALGASGKQNASSSSQPFSSDEDKVNDSLSKLFNEDPSLSKASPASNQ